MSENKTETNKDKKKSLEQRLATIGGIAGTVIGTLVVGSFLYYRPDVPNLLIDLPCTFSGIAVGTISGYYCGSAIGLSIDTIHRIQGGKNQNE